MHNRQSRVMRTNHVLMMLFVGGALISSTLGIAAGDAFYLRLGTEALIFGGLALSVDLLLGYTGVLSLGQALYFGVGAYASALVLLHVPSFSLAMIAAGGASLVSSILGGLIANRVRGVYFTLITMGLAQVVAKIVYNSRDLGASDGIIGIPIIKIGLGVASVSTADPAGFFLIVLGIIVALYVFLAYLLETPFGRVFIALKANERRVPFLGYSVWRARMVAYVLAGVIAGLSGALYPMLRGFVSPELMFFMTSGNGVISTLLGGTGTLVGALYGSVLLVVIKSAVGSWTEHHLVVIGLLFMFSVLFLPRGLLGIIHPWLQRALARKAPAEDVRRHLPISDIKS